MLIVLLSTLADGFQLTLYGRFWVTPEVVRLKLLVGISLGDKAREVAGACAAFTWPFMNMSNFLYKGLSVGMNKLRAFNQ